MTAIAKRTIGEKRGPPLAIASLAFYTVLVGTRPPEKPRALRG